MAIVLPQGRPAINVVEGSYERPEDPWAHLGDPGPRAHLEAAISAVGRVDCSGHPTLTFLGTAFVVGPGLLLTKSLRPVLAGDGAAGTFAPGMSAAVDFGHEVLPRELIRAEIEEVVYVDSRWGVELVRAALPETITPLELSVLEPDALVDREVVLLGYPSFDPRNDEALMQRIFAGQWDVKRLLPGRIHGAGSLPDNSNLGGLVHDCTSTGGCGGSPLVDIGTGEVVGVQFAGLYLQANHAVPALELARDGEFARAGVRFAGDLPGEASAEEERRGTSPGDDLSLEGIVEAASAAMNMPPADATTAAASAYDIENTVGQERPALLVETWRTEVIDPWRPLLAPYEKQLDLAVRAVGKLFDGTAPDSWSGSAFLVGDRLAITASFVAQAFADGVGLSTTIKPGTAAAIDFSEALGMPSGSATAAVTGVRFIHPSFHVALLELERMPEGVGVLDLAAQLPSQLSGRLVVVVAFAGARVAHPPERADFEDSLYQDRWGRLFVQPGKAVALGQLPDDTRLPALVHDCVTAAGSAGAPVIDLGTGYVLGVHSHAKWREGGFAQPTWELARDPNVWRYAIGFRPDPRPPWLDDWNAPAAQPPKQPDAPPEVDPSRWTVDDVPIDWSRKEPKELERILVATINAQAALYQAENVGLQIGMLNPSGEALFLWREILKSASTAGVLRRLLADLADAPQYAGIAPRLRTYL